MTDITDEMIAEAARAIGNILKNRECGLYPDWDVEGSETQRIMAESILKGVLAGRTVIDLPQPDGDVDILATDYQVSILPRDDINRASWAIDVSYRGGGQYAVKHYSHCLSRSGTWDYEARPSDREDDWIAEHRFELDEALRLAAQHAPTVVTNGRTAVEVLAWIREREASGVSGGGAQ